MPNHHLIELSALRADFFDGIKWIYMISLLFSYLDHPVYPVKKLNPVGCIPLHHQQNSWNADLQKGQNHHPVSRLSSQEANCTR